jgi:hypothetical protein
MHHDDVSAGGLEKKKGESQPEVDTEIQCVYFQENLFGTNIYKSYIIHI